MSMHSVTYYGNRDGTRGEEPYSIQLNGNINRAPPWPVAQRKNEKMFILPKKLGSKDSILVQGITTNQRSRLTIGLVTGFESPDYSNVACQLEINFYDNKISIQIIQDGNYEIVNDENAATDYFADPPYFEVEFRMRSEEILDIVIGASLLESVELKHNLNDIRFLIIDGDVEKVSRLDFKFG